VQQVRDPAFNLELRKVRDRLAASIAAQDDCPEGFDLDRWLEDWLDRPQAALGGQRPAELLGSDEGVASVCRALGATMSGAYQ